jgi:hypothetical protein
MIYMFGLSYRGVEKVLDALECAGGKSSIERDVEEAGQKVREFHQACAGKVRVETLGVDGTGAAMAGRNSGVLFFVDIRRQKLICLQPVQESDADAVRRHVRRVMALVGAKELRTDEHSAYDRIVPEGCHRICLSHWRKSKGKRAWDLLQEGIAECRPLEVQTMQELLALLRKQPRAPTAPEELEVLVRRYINARRGLPWKVNQLLQHVERTWEKVSDDRADPTNNATERVIGLTFKIRAKTMRGFKAMHKVLAHPYLASFLRGEDGVCDLRKVI